MSSYVHDPIEHEQAVDASPTVVIEQGQQSYKDADKHKLKALVQAAEKLQGSKDQKLQSCIATVESFLKEEMNPIVWCRYIATGGDFYGSKLSVTISNLYDYVFTKILKLSLKACNSQALEFSDKSNQLSPHR